MCNIKRLEKAFVAFTNRLSEEDKDICQVTKVTVLSRLGHESDIKIDFTIPKKEEDFNDLLTFTKSNIKMMEASMENTTKDIVRFGSGKDDTFYVVIRP